jgi:hypothetical protein
MGASNPIEVWDAVAYGNESPEVFTRSLKKVQLGDLPAAVANRVSQRHPDDVPGTEYHCAMLGNDVDASIAVTNDTGAKSGAVAIELFPGAPDVYYSWQRGLIEVQDYYLSAKTGLCSIIELVQKITNKKVQMYFYDETIAAKENARVMKLRNREGEEYYTLFVHNPKTLGEVASLLHEFGHIITMETQGTYYQEIDEKFQSDPDWLTTSAYLEKIQQSWEGQKPTKQEEQQAEMGYYFSLGFLKRQDLEMAREVDAWSATIELIHNIGPLVYLDPHSDEFTNYMWWCIKTRIPRREYFENN